jgi:hypothetical protein
MDARFRWTPYWVFVAAAVLLLTAGPMVTHGGATQPNSAPPPPLRVLEQNVDPSGFIRVHEQGVATVNGTVAVSGPVAINGTVAVSGGEVAVTNLPSTQTVKPGAVTGALSFDFTVGSLNTLLTPFDSINATAIHIFTENEVHVVFQSPLSSLNFGGIPNTLLRFLGRERALRNFITTFPQPVPLNGMWMACQETSFSCGVTISVIGD